MPWDNADLNPKIMQGNIWLWSDLIWRTDAGVAEDSFYNAAATQNDFSFI